MTRDSRNAPFTRCVLVWAVGSIATAGTLLLVRTDLAQARLLVDPSALADARYLDALTSLAAVLVAGCALWAWFTASLAVLEAATNVRVSGCPLLLRRVILVACGVSLASGITPVVADQSAGLPPPHADSGRSALAGLQVPDRSPDPLTKPQARVASRAGHTAAQPGGRDLTGRPLMTGSRVVIHRGDTLWSIAARSLPSGPNDVEIQQRWHDIWKQNRLVIGDDPDLIHPGTVLRLPATADHPRPAGKEEN